MVTGAGGSIGSELCRQILPTAPRSAWSCSSCASIALYTVERELAARCSHQTEPADRNRAAAGQCRQPTAGARGPLHLFEVQTVYHAAAYKHVPIVEHNVIDGIHNNVIGTWHAAEAAIEAAVDTFVLVSTDKAVNPTNVMGASKQLAELVLQALQQRTKASLLHGSVEEGGGFIRLSGAAVPGADPPGWTGHGDAPGRGALLHDHSRGRTAGHTGRGDGRRVATYSSSTWDSRCESMIWRAV